MGEMGCKLHCSELHQSPGVLTERCKASPQLPAPFTDAAKQEPHMLGEGDMKIGLKKIRLAPMTAIKSNRDLEL